MEYAQSIRDRAARITEGLDLTDSQKRSIERRAQVQMQEVWQSCYDECANVKKAEWHT